LLDLNGNASRQTSLVVITSIAACSHSWPQGSNNIGSTAAIATLPAIAIQTGGPTSKRRVIIQQMGRHSNLIIAHTFATELEAEIARSALEAAGIAAIIQADTAGGMRPHIAWSGSGFRILVREEDASAAHDVLEPPAEHS